jgi:hypothetical protein
MYSLSSGGQQSETSFTITGSKSKWWQGTLPLDTLQEKSLSDYGFWQLLAFPELWLYHTSLKASIFKPFFFPAVSYKDTNDCI